MIKKELLDALAKLNFWGKDQEVGIERNGLKEAVKFVDIKDISLVIIGVRRCGKTFFAKQILAYKIKEGLAKEQTLYVNFEEPSLEPYLGVQLLDDIYESYRYYLNRDKPVYMVLDEIQNVPRWEKWVRMMQEKNENVRIILTGSSSALLSPELASVLTGRTITRMMYPLSFSEFLRFKGEDVKKFKTKENMRKLLEEYIEFGGFPMVVLNDDKDFKSIYLKEIFAGIIERDIIRRHKIREEHELKSLAAILINNFASLTSVRRLDELMFNITKRKLSPSTINKYFKYFEESCLLFFVPIFSYKIKDQLQYPRKVYCIDTGIINEIALKFSPNKGKLYQNIVAIELIKRFGLENVFYWKSKKQEEVDFVVKEKLKPKQLVQVCYDIEGAKEREVRSLIKASEELKVKELIVITAEYEKEERINGRKIKFIPLWKWLLEEKE